MKEYRYKVYNPNTQSIESVLTTEPIENDWEFIRVVPISPYEVVAIFIKQDL